MQSRTVNKDFFPQSRQPGSLEFPLERNVRVRLTASSAGSGRAQREGISGRRFTWCPSASTLGSPGDPAGGSPGDPAGASSLRTTKGWLRISRLKQVEDSGTRVLFTEGYHFFHLFFFPCAFGKSPVPISRVLQTDPCLNTMRFGEFWHEVTRECPSHF